MKRAYLDNSSLWILFRVKGGEVIQPRYRFVEVPARTSYLPAFAINGPEGSYWLTTYHGDQEGEAAVYYVDQHLENGSLMFRPLVIGDFDLDQPRKNEYLRLTLKGERIISHAPQVKELRQRADRALELNPEDGEVIEQCFYLAIEALTRDYPNRVLSLFDEILGRSDT